MREWVIYAVFMTIVFTLFFRDSGLVGAISGLLVSGPLYLGLGAVLAKLGLQRKSISQLRAERAEIAARRNTPADPARGSAPRPRPAPTRRTGGQRPGQRPNRRR